MHYFLWPQDLRGHSRAAEREGELVLPAVPFAAQAVAGRVHAREEEARPQEEEPLRWSAASASSHTYHKTTYSGWGALAQPISGPGGNWLFSLPNEKTL